MMTVQINFDNLSSYQKRSFVAEGEDLMVKDTVLKYYNELNLREIGSVDQLKKWVLDRSELEAIIDQQGSVLYIKMTCQTANLSHVEAYKSFIENIVPATKPFEHQLDKKYLSVCKQFELDRDRFFVYDRAHQMDVEIFREESIPLETELQLLAQEYQTICGAMTVSFKGEEKTLPQMNKYLYQVDRSLRESAWTAMAQRRYQDKDQLDSILDKMIAKRDQVAHHAGYSNFCDYQFCNYHRFDYTPQDCKEYHNVVERLVVPVWQKILKRRQEHMGVDTLRPWDLHVDPLGRVPLKPFTEVEDLIKKVNKIFKLVHPELERYFSSFSQKGLLDLASRKGKAPGGYQNTLSESRLPFIFMNAVGLDDDVRTLLHEGGHAFHAIACAADEIYDYRHAPIEFCEVASMSMELLGGEFLSVFYNEEDAKRSRISHLESIIQILIWVANVDAFQHWLYENPKHTSDERTAAWLETSARFSGNLVNWNGLEDFRSTIWHRQLHIFEVPLYYIEYGIAQLGALQVWIQAKKTDPLDLMPYLKALSLGGARPLPELFEAAGLKFDFSQRTIAPLIEFIQKEIDLN